MSKKHGYQSGWYKSQGDQVFHVLGRNMSRETIDALGAIADAVKAMQNFTCPQCGGKYGETVDFTDKLYRCYRCGLETKAVAVRNLAYSWSSGFGGTGVPASTSVPLDLRVALIIAYEGKRRKRFPFCPKRRACSKAFAKLFSKS